MHHHSPKSSSTSKSSSDDFFMPKIVITGGPACGKTTSIEFIRSQRSDILIVDEIASKVLSSSHPVISDSNPYSKEWQDELQAKIAAEQVRQESLIKTDPQNQIFSAVLFDRGLPDAASYLDGGMEELSHITSQEPHEMLLRYDAVIYLSWIGDNNYQTVSNLVRFEDVKQAKNISTKLRNIWAKHPNFIEIKQLENRPEHVLNHVDYFLSNLAE